MGYLKEEELKNIKEFQYKCKNDSIVYNNVTSPLLDWLVNYLPMWLAPNVLTIFSFIFNFITFIVIVFEAGNDFTYELSRFTCFLQVITHLLYILLDNIDGKQARRTGSSSPLGLLFDHGLDALTTCIVAYNMSHMVMFGNSGIRSSLFFISLYTGFWANVYEEYVINHMHLGMINGADEGNMIVAVASLLSCIFSPQMWNIQVLSFPISDCMLAFITLGSIQNIFQCISSLYSHTKSFNKLFVFLIDSFNYILCTLVPIIALYFDNATYIKNTSMLMAIYSITFARIIIEMQVNQVASRKYSVNKLILITNLLAIIFLMHDYPKSLFDVKFILGLLIAINAISLIVFVLEIINEIKVYLGIKVFTIKTITENLKKQS
jgi:ethanolaminephosphotransferase